LHSAITVALCAHIYAAAYADSDVEAIVNIRTCNVSLRRISAPDKNGVKRSSNNGAISIPVFKNQLLFA